MRLRGGAAGTAAVVTLKHQHFVAFFTSGQEAATFTVVTWGGQISGSPSPPRLLLYFGTLAGCHQRP